MSAAFIKLNLVHFVAAAAVTDAATHVAVVVYIQLAFTLSAMESLNPVSVLLN